MFRKAIKKLKARKLTETINVNGTNVVMYSNRTIEKKGAKKKIAEYAITAKGQIDTMETLINIDFFDGKAKIKITQIDEETVFVKIVV